MANEKRLLAAIGTIERALGNIEGVAFTLEDKYSDTIFKIINAVEMLDGALKEIIDGK